MFKKHNWYVQNRQGDFENSIDNEEATELICMTYGHELRRGVHCWRAGGKEGNIGTTVIA